MRYSRRIRRYSRISKKPLRIRRRKLKSRRSLLYAKRLIRKYSLPTAIKNIGMSEKKSYVFRVIQPYTNNMAASTQGGHYVYQLVLDPSLSPDFSKLYDNQNITYKDGSNKDHAEDVKIFKYDYLKINKILIVIRPVQGMPTSNINTNPDGINTILQQQPSSLVYGYYTLKNPFIMDGQANNAILAAFSNNPSYDSIKYEGKNKQVFSFPSNKSLTLNLNSVKWRCNSLSPCVLGNKLWDTQNIAPCQYTQNNYFSIFNEPIVRTNLNDDTNDSENSENIEYKNSEDYEMRGDAEPNGITVDALNQKAYNINAGRVVLISQIPYKFTYEIYYHVSCYR